MRLWGRMLAEPSRTRQGYSRHRRSKHHRRHHQDQADHCPQQRAHHGAPPLEWDRSTWARCLTQLLELPCMKRAQTCRLTPYRRDRLEHGSLRKLSFPSLKPLASKKQKKTRTGPRKNGRCGTTTNRCRMLRRTSSKARRTHRVKTPAQRIKMIKRIRTARRIVRTSRTRSGREPPRRASARRTAETPMTEAMTHPPAPQRAQRPVTRSDDARTRRRIENADAKDAVPQNDAEEVRVAVPHNLAAHPMADHGHQSRGKA